MIRARSLLPLAAAAGLAGLLLPAAAAAGFAGLGGAALLPSKHALAEIPPAYLRTYLRAAAGCPGLPWSVLAGIGEVESDQGRNAGRSAAGAVGVVQMLPATFAEYAASVPPGGMRPPSPADPVDEIYAAARDLCANGARGGRNIAAAIYAYNHDRRYVREVLAAAARYTRTLPLAANPAAAAAIGYALDALGTPYRWGGEGPGGFDCSGLTQAAYAAAGIAIPRTSEAQWLALPHVPPGEIAPGDLVFFDPGEFLPGLPGHVGIYLGAGRFVDAPHAGASVRIDTLAHFSPLFGVARPTKAAGR